jgi:acetate---CoA ligase (ADP-forming)
LRASVDPNTQVDALLNPRNVVIVGATDKPGNWAERVKRNLSRYGFPGPIYPFNPGRDFVWNGVCYKSFADLPEPPDHLVVLIPAKAVPAVLVDAANAGARSATVMTSGFDEDEAARTLALELKLVLAQTGLAVSGPNCLGNMNAAAQFMTMPDDRPQKVVAGPVAVIGQSGGIAMSIKRTLEERGTDTGAVITSGNETGLTTADYIRYFAERPDIRVIVSYLESVHDTGAFLAAAQAARDQGKTVIVVKLGASSDGRAAALAHTGRLAGVMEAFDAVAGEAGVIRVKNLDAVVEAVEYLVHAPLPEGRGLGAITFSGGFRGMLLDAAAGQGLKFSPLAKATRKRLEQLLAVGTIIGNPLDAGFAALTSQDAYLKCIERLLDDPGIDALLLQEELPRGPGTERKESNLRSVEAIAARAKKPVAFITMISHGLTDYSRTLRAELPHLPFLQEFDKTLSAVRSVMDYAERLRSRSTNLPSPLEGEGGAKRRKGGAAEKLKTILSCAPAGPLSEVDSKSLLKAYGIATPKERVARTEREAINAVRRIGFPVVMKAVAPELAHKSDIGAVVLGLKSAAEVRNAYKRILVATKRARVTLDGVLIAEQMSDGLELVIGANRDPEMGPVVLFGAGGVALELNPDVAVSAPLRNERAARVLIARTRVAKRIAGYRGLAALDEEALAKALLAVSRLAVDLGPRLVSIDVNPILLKRRGGFALDALVVLASANETQDS